MVRAIVANVVRTNSSVYSRSIAVPTLAWKLEIHLWRAIRLIAFILLLLRHMAVAFIISLSPMAVVTSLGRLKEQAMTLLVRLQLSIGVVVHSVIAGLAWYPARLMAASMARALISGWLVKSVKV